MSTILFRLSAPLQAWGTEPRFDKWIRTGMEPSKSGVIGLVASAMGIDRTDGESLAELTKSLRMGVCVDREGIIGTDYHAVRLVSHPDCSYKDMYSESVFVNGKKLPESAISRYDYKKYYLMDAAFTIGLESDDEKLLCDIQEYLRHPKRILFLGRKSCPLTEELDSTIVNLPLRMALEEHINATKDGRYHTYRLIYDTESSERGTIINDVPVSFNNKKKVWAPRNVSETMIEVFPENEQHDPFAFL